MYAETNAYFSWMPFYRNCQKYAVIDISQARFKNRRINTGPASARRMGQWLDI